MTQSRRHRTPPLTGVFARVGVRMARRRRKVYGWWLLAVVIGLLSLPHLFSSVASPSTEVRGSESAIASQKLGEGLPWVGNEPLVMVLHSPALAALDPVFQSAVQRTLTALSVQRGITSVLVLPVPGDPRPLTTLPAALEPLKGLYSDEHTVYVLVGTSGDGQERQDRVPAQAAAADDAARAASDGAVRAYLVGTPSFGHAAQQVELTDMLHIEMVAIPLAILVMLLGLRAPLVALLPVAVAGAAVTVTLGFLSLMTTLFRVDGTLLIGVSALGLGVGIDYSLFVVTRYREEIAAGVRPEQAVAAALATSGRTAFYSALVVVLSVASLLLVRWPVIGQFTLGVILVVLATQLAVMTLLPAALVSLTRRLEWRPGWLRSPRRVPAEQGRLARWVRHLMRHPWPYAAGVTAVLLLLALPVANLTMAIGNERDALAKTQYGMGMAHVERDAPGLSVPVVILVERPPSPVRPNVDPLIAALRADPDVAVVTRVDNAKDLTAVIALPREGKNSPRIPELVHRIRADIVPQYAPAGHTVLVGGSAALVADILTECATKLWWIIGTVLAMMFLLLVAVFRSLLLPLKAIAMNLLATAAAIGLMVALFQSQWAQRVFDLNGDTTIWPQVPILVFVLLFAVSMDYELFLVLRIQEEYRATGDNTRAVAAGVQRTARPISLAAVILAVAFGSLLASQLNGLKQFGFAIATALIIDATLIRLILVPALMQIMGRWNWWLPFVPVTSGSGDRRGRPQPRLPVGG